MFIMRPVTSESDIAIVTTLAEEIWNQHFVPIIGQAQVDYMLEQFQSAAAIQNQISEGCEYYLVSNQNTPAGYLCLITDDENRHMMLSKLYMRETERSQGGGTTALNFAKALCEKRQLEKLWLTVNRYNTETINWYLNRGFVISDEVKKDIGNGFFMDDYIMELRINQ